MADLKRLIESLPAVRGKMRSCVSLAQVTWFRVGGPAEVMFRPEDVDDLVDFLANKRAEVPVMPMGVGSNLLVRDGGIKGVVVRLGRGFADVKINGNTVTVGAGALDANVAQATMAAGLTGLEFLSGIPGTIGGALRMNAGAYGREIKDTVTSATAVDGEGVLHKLSADDLGFSYRSCRVPGDWIFTSATFHTELGDPQNILAAITEIQDARSKTQPIRARTGGSTFKNPNSGAKAWELIDQAGFRGKVRGGAMVSDQHCNFLINTGDATAGDLEALGDEVRASVAANSGVTLDWEILRAGHTEVDGPCFGASVGLLGQQSLAPAEA